jgi:type IV secretion system protein VirB4
MFKIKGAAREREPDTYVPFIGHASAGVLLLDDGSLLTMLRLDGAAFELADTGEVNSRHAQLNILLRNIASDRVVVATHVVRTLAEDAIYPDKLCTSTFARELDATYRKQLMSARLFRNELFLSILLRPAGSAGVMDGNFLRLFTRRKRGDRSRIASTANLDLLGTIVASITSDLSAYGVELLGLREAGGVMFSEIAEALRLILTGEHLPVPLVNGHLGGAIYTDRVIVGREAIEIRGVSGSTFAAGFALLEYPARTRPGMFDSILAAPYRCVLTQTYGFLTKQNAQGIMSRKQNQMVSANDKAASQTIALTEAADMLASNEFAMGDHHLTLVTFADNLDRLGDVAGRARRDLAESGAVVAREDLALEAAYWGQLPGNMKLRVRPGVISSRNFAAMSSLHNYPLGVKRGHWGEPLTLFRSTGGTAYRFHLHAPTETVQDVGNVFMAGPSGSGKTTLTLFILAMVERQGAQVVFFDKDRGGEILAHAVGGTYLVLTSGSPTGLAPLKALTSSSTDTKFIAQLVKALVGLEPGKELLPEQERRLALGVQAVMELPKEARSLGELRAFLGQSDPEGTGAKLDKWCKGGALGWVLDNDNDTVALDAPFLGFDVTAFLDDATTRGPILS